MNRSDRHWQKLTALARQAGDPRGTAAPFGFATRVAARAAHAPAPTYWAVFERFARRGLVLAAVLGVGAIAFNYSTLLTEPADAYASTDTVSEILDFS